MDLSKNKLKQLPDNFGDLTKLKHLDLYKNELQHLPLSFSKLKGLRWLDLKDNPLVPAIKETAGQCLDSKQCLKCAKDIVHFYSALQEKIDQERQNRELQRQKAKSAQQLSGNEQKGKVQEKKSKKAQKKKTNGALSSVNLQKKNGTTKLNANMKKDKKKTKDSSLLSIFKFSILVFITTIIGLSILSAAGSTFAQSVFSNINVIWNDNLNKLPPNFINYGRKFEFVIKEAHDVIGNSTRSFINYLENSKTEDNVLNKILQKIYIVHDYLCSKLHNFYKIVVQNDNS